MKAQKVVGIIGGLGPASTIDYYKGIIKEYKKYSKDYPEIIIYSLNMTEIMNYLDLNKYDLLVKKIAKTIDNMEKAGADFVAISSNTPHLVFDEIQKSSNLPLISIVETSVKESQKNEFKKVLIIGTSFTMNNDFYKNSFNDTGIECISPNDSEKEIIHNIIFPNLENGIVISQDKKKLIDILENINTREKIDAVILACTELPLMIQDDDLTIPVINTTKIHIKEITNKLLNNLKINK